MRTKSWVLLAVALGCGLVASVAISQVVKDQRKTVNIPTVEILVAVQNIDTQGRLSKDNIKLEKWPKDRVPQGAITDLKNADGKFAKQTLFQGEPIIDKKIASEVDGLSTKVPPGYRIFDLAVNDKDGGVGYIKAGDRVDVLGFFEKAEKIPETKSLTVVENVVVKAVDGNDVRDNGEQGPKSTKTIQLMIRDSQMEVLNTASNLGKLKVALRGSNSDNGDDSTQVDNGEVFMAWLKTAERNESSKESKPKTPKSSILETLAKATTAAPENTAPEMVIISNNKVERWRFTKNNDLPELVTPESKQEKATTASPAVTGFNGSNMVWDPAAGKWTTSGLSPSYPSPKKGSETGDLGEGSSEPPDSEQ